MEVDKELYLEIKEFCSINGLKPRDYINGLLKKAFLEDKYGKRPPIFNKKESVPIKEPVVEIVLDKEEPVKDEKPSETISEIKKLEPEMTTKQEVKAIEEKPIVKTRKRKLN